MPYPGLRGYRDLIAEEERGMGDVGVDEDTVALAQTLNFWRDTRLLHAFWLEQSLSALSQRA